ncbi:MAG: tyrosine-type recombinase/integrase [Litorilinea sp.]
MKLSSVLDGYWLEKELSFSPHTIAAYSRVYHRFVAFVGDVDIERVTANDIRRFLAHLRTEYNLSRRSVHDAWIPLSSLWTWAENELGTPHIIRGKVRAPEFTKTTIEPFTKREISALVNGTDQNKPWRLPTGARVRSRRPTALRDRAIVLTLLDTGLRVSELCQLALGDYDVSRGRLHIRHGKGDKARFVVMGNRTRMAIWRYLAQRGTPHAHEPLFATRSTLPMRRDNVGNMLKLLAERAGVANVYPHRFRHTFAVTFLRNGGSPLLLQELLGHTDLATVRTYVRLAEQDIAAGVKHSPVDTWRL